MVQTLRLKAAKNGSQVNATTRAQAHPSSLKDVDGLVRQSTAAICNIA
jgi:hypothetical protein